MAKAPQVVAAEVEVVDVVEEKPVVVVAEDVGTAWHMM